MAKNLLTRVGKGVLALGIGTASLSGCATIKGNIEFEMYQRELEKAKKELGINNIALLDRNLRNSYYASIWGGNDLRLAAGIAAGTIKVQKTENGYKGEGTFSQYSQQEILDQACELADRDRNKIITNKEAQDLLLAAYKTATERWVNR